MERRNLGWGCRVAIVGNSLTAADAKLLRNALLQAAFTLDSTPSEQWRQLVCDWSSCSILALHRSNASGLSDNSCHE